MWEGATARESLDLLSTRDEREIVVVDGRLKTLTVAGLLAVRDRWRERLRADRKLLVEIAAPRSVNGLAAYLAALSLGHAVVLVDGAPPGLASASRAAFCPDLAVENDVVRWASGRTAAPVGRALHPALAMIVSTSGSAGVPRAVRLSYDNLHSNARAIAAATGIAPGERAATSLPADYVFGLSIINSYLVSGGSLALTDAAPTAKSFWWQFDQLEASAIGLLPTTCRLLLSRGWNPRTHPSIGRMLLAGGRLDPAEASKIVALMASVDGQVNIMYGQAEATARISVLDTASAAEHPGSVGRVVPGGSVAIVADDGRPVAAGGVGEIVYTGPNVMLGYATSRADLSLGDTHGSRLRTGDLGYLLNGMLYLTGRVDRQVKVLGRRIQLDQLEAECRSAVGTEVVLVPQPDETITVCHEGGATAGIESEAKRLADRYGLPRGCLRVREMALPRLFSGKLDYRSLRAQLEKGN